MTELPKVNPLADFMRHPEIFIKLPSQGYFSNPEDFELSADGNLGVAPMTASDEIILKSPEGLLNGDSVARVIQSCAPGVYNVYNMSAPDIDAILVAIRLVSYGDDMEYDITCPKCKHHGTYATSLKNALQNIIFLEEEYEIELHNHLKVYVRPFRYEDSIKEEIQKYYQMQAMRFLAEEDLEDVEKAKKYTEHVQKIADLITELCAGCIEKIVDSDGDIIQASKEDILEWVRNLSRGDAEKITSTITKINGTGIDKTTKIKCVNCEYEWETEVSYDPSHFFV